MSLTAVGKRVTTVTVLSAALVAGGSGIASASPTTHPDVTQQAELDSCGPGADNPVWNVQTGRWSNECSTLTPPIVLPKVLKKSAKHWWNPWSWLS